MSKRIMLDASGGYTRKELRYSPPDGSLSITSLPEEDYDEEQQVVVLSADQLYWVLTHFATREIVQPIGDW